MCLIILVLLANLLFFDKISADKTEEKFNQILSDLLQSLNLSDNNKGYPIRKDIISNQWIIEIYKNAKIDVENEGNKIVRQFALRNFLRKIHSFAFSHIIDIGRKGANRCRDNDEAVLFGGFLNAFSANHGLKQKMEEFVGRNNILEFFEMLYSFSIKCESLLEGIPIEGEKRGAEDKKLKILIEAYNCMGFYHKNSEYGRIFLDKIKPFFGKTGNEFNGIFVDWNEKYISGSGTISERRRNLETFIKFNKEKTTPLKWLRIARKFIKFNTTADEPMLIQLVRYLDYDCELNHKAAIFGIGVMQKLLDEGNKNGYLAQFQGIANDIQKAKKMAEIKFKRRFKECSSKINAIALNNFTFYEAFLHYEDVIEIDWDEKKSYMGQIYNLKQLERYVEYLQRNEENFKIEIDLNKRISSNIEDQYKEMVEYYEMDKRYFYGVDLVRMYVEKFGIFAKNVPSQIEREFDLWHLVGKMDQELDDLEDWLTRDIVGTELLKKYVQEMEELDEFHVNYGIMEIVENLKENINDLDEKREEMKALNAMQKNVKKFAEICKNIKKDKKNALLFSKWLVNSLYHEIGKFMKIAKDRKETNGQMSQNEKQKGKMEEMKTVMGKFVKKGTKKWADFTKPKTNPEDEKSVKGMENIRKSFAILAEIRTTLA